MSSCLVVTVPDGGRYGASQPMVTQLPDDTNVLITRKLRTVAASVIDALRPDVIISAAFPRLIPAEILEIPKFGAINCHPSPLPAGRGPTPQRLIYEGDERVAASVHQRGHGAAGRYDVRDRADQRRPQPGRAPSSKYMRTAGRFRPAICRCVSPADQQKRTPGDPGVLLRLSELRRRPTPRGGCGSGWGQPGHPDPSWSRRPSS